MSQNQSLYETLGIARNASDKEIKSAYRKLAKQWHPDQNSGSKEAEEKFKEIQNAYEILSDAQKRLIYDQTGDATRAGSRAGAPHQDQTGFDTNGFWRQAGRPIVLNANILTRIEVTLESCLKPIINKVKFDRPIYCADCKGTGGGNGAQQETCADCGGGGVVTKATKTQFGVAVVQIQCETCHGRGFKQTVTCGKCHGTGTLIEKAEEEICIPVGGAGSRVVFHGLGGTANVMQPAGVLLVDVFIKPHKTFSLNQDASISYTLHVDPIEAILGESLKVPTLEGDEVNIKLASKSRDGKQYIVKGRGLPVDSRNRADMRVDVTYDLPSELNDGMRAALQDYLKAKKAGSPTVEPSAAPEMADKENTK